PENTAPNANVARSSYSPSSRFGEQTTFSTSSFDSIWCASGTCSAAISRHCVTHARSSRSTMKHENLSLRSDELVDYPRAGMEWNRVARSLKEAADSHGRGPQPLTIRDSACVSQAPKSTLRRKALAEPRAAD